MSILSKEEIKFLLKQIPIGRFAKVEEIAKTAVFLCSDLKSYITVSKSCKFNNGCILESRYGKVTFDFSDVKDIDYYISSKFQYLIIVESLKNRTKSESFLKKYPGIAEFYKSIDDHQRLKLIKKIEPTSRNRGHTYLIYKLLLDS